MPQKFLHNLMTEKEGERF